jgi:hypothetical protein
LLVLLRYNLHALFGAAFATLLFEVQGSALQGSADGCKLLCEQMTSAAQLL